MNPAGTLSCSQEVPPVTAHDLSRRHLPARAQSPGQLEQSCYWEVHTDSLRPLLLEAGTGRQGQDAGCGERDLRAVWARTSPSTSL